MEAFIMRNIIYPIGIILSFFGGLFLGMNGLKIESMLMMLICVLLSIGYKEMWNLPSGGGLDF
jgi:hypothetical protein